MVKHLITAAAALAITAAASASANDFNEKKKILDIPLFDMLLGNMQTFQISLDDGKPVVGFNFEGDYWDDGPGGPTWWASDLAMTITSPAGRAWTVGGWDNVATRNENWMGWPGSSGGMLPPAQPTAIFPNDGQNFDANGLQIPVFLHADHFPWKEDPQPKEGIWTITLWTDFAAVEPGPRPAFWTDISIAVYNVPSPGALALLGVAGLLTKRRRRQ